MDFDSEQFWNQRIEQLRKWRRQHPEMAPKLYMLMRQFQKMKFESCKHLQQYNSTKRPQHLKQAMIIVDQADVIYKRLSKLELIASLAK